MGFFYPRWLCKWPYFIRPRDPNGSWLNPFSATKSGTWPDYFYEADSWEYSLYVPQDVRQLIQECGGREKFVQRLNLLFDDKHIDIGDEPAFLDPVLYIWAGRPDRTADRKSGALRNHGSTSSEMVCLAGTSASWSVLVCSYSSQMCEK